MADALSQRNVVDAMVMSPDRLSVQRTASPAATPLNYDRYDCMRNKSPSSGPPPRKSMSSSSVVTIQLWYPTPRVTDPSVAIIMFTGIVGSHPKGVPSVGISLTSICIFRGSALIQHPMLDLYGSKGGRSNVVRRVILHLPVTSTNRVLVFVSTTCVARVGRAQSVEWFKKLRRAPLVTECCSHMQFEWWNNVFCFASKYHSDCWWCCSNQSPSCGITQLSSAKWYSANC
jgi:hypothetical protein